GAGGRVTPRQGPELGRQAVLREIAERGRLRRVEALGLLAPDAREHESALGARQRDVEEPHAFGALARGGRLLDPGPAGARRTAQLLLARRAVESVGRPTALAAGGHPGQEDALELEALRGVDREEAHRVLDLAARARLLRLALLFQRA